MRNIYIDIETVPSDDSWVRDYVEKTVTHPGQMKKPETIAKWVDEEKPAAIDEAMAKCSFDGAMNQIICIGVASDNEPVQTFVRSANTDMAELKILNQLFEFLGPVKPQLNTCIVGHNVAGFDLRVIRQRSMVWGIKPPSWMPFDAKPWDSHSVYDTMMQWDARNLTKLDKLARAFGIEGKSTDGSMVAKMWRDGRTDEIADYCAADVELTRKVHQRMTYGG